MNKTKKKISIIFLIIIIIVVFKGVFSGNILQRFTSPKDWNLILVNSNHPIPKNYDFELTQLSNGISIDSRIYPDLQSMFDDARSNGIYPIVGEGYRTNED